MMKLPKTMKAAYIDRYGDNNAVQMDELPVPEVGDNDVLVQVKAASVNPLDTRIRDGKLKQVLHYKLPLILGNDFAGVVVAVGPSVINVKVGDEVYARTDTMRIGSFAEYIAINQDNVAKKPKNLSMEEAGALPLVALTAWQALVDNGNVKKEQKVLIHGGAGGVGSMAIQLAKHLGAHVATTASAADTDTVKKYGADQVIDYRTEDFSNLLSGYDFVLDTRGGETLQKSLTVLKPGGMVVSVNGTPNAPMADELNLGPLMKLVFTAMSFKTNNLAKKLGVKYSFLFMQPSGVQLTKLAKLFENKTLKPVIDKVYPFASTRDALAYSESGKAKGKIVINV